MIDVAAERAAAVAEAYRWLGTPFHDGQAVKGAGVDCGRLVISIYASIGAVPPFTPNFYSPQWFLHTREEKVLDLLSPYCARTSDPQPGDLAVFTMARVVGHLAMITDFPEIIHADATARVVRLDRCSLHDALGHRFAGCYTLKRWHA